jgi:hypothetical protein
MENREPSAWMPEFIDTLNLDGLTVVHGTRVQFETRQDLRKLANTLDITLDEAARYAIEVGIVALIRERVIG